MLKFSGAILFAFQLFYSVVFAQSAPENEPLPNLMSLSQALAQSNEHHPAVLKHRARMLALQAQTQVITLNSQWQGDFDLSARLSDLVNDEDDFKGDSRASLSISKIVWDFGRAKTEAELVDIGGQSTQLGLEFSKRLQRIEIMRRFFEVLAADHQFSADNEAMSLAFFPFNRARERRERFDNVSELEVMEKRVDYFKQLTLRNQTQLKQRASRYRLALAMGRPNASPVDLIAPDLTAYDREIPEFDELLVKVLSSSPKLKQKQLELKQLQAQQDAINTTHKPSLKLALSAHQYEQDHRSRDQARAVLALNVPLLTQHSSTATFTQLAATISAKEAEVLALDYEIREQVLTWLQRLAVLKQSRDQNAQNLEYRERALDKSRLLYEMDVRARIGQSQADMAKLLWQDAKVRYEQAIIWEQIDAVLDAPLVEFK